MFQTKMSVESKTVSLINGGFGFCCCFFFFFNGFSPDKPRKTAKCLRFPNENPHLIPVSIQGLTLPHPTGETGISQTLCNLLDQTQPLLLLSSIPSRSLQHSKDPSEEPSPACPRKSLHSLPHPAVLTYPAALHKILPFASQPVLRPPGPSSNNQY